MVVQSILIAVTLFVLCLVDRTADAALITEDPPAGAQFALVQGAVPASVSYDATSEVFAATAQWHSGAVVTVAPPFDSLVHDIVGTFSLTAMIDNSGRVLGGSFALTGNSLALGVTAPTTLLSGRVEDLGSPLGSSTTTDFLADISIVDPHLRTLIGLPQIAQLDFVSLIDDFRSSFSYLTATEAPEIYLVSEPGPGFLLLSGIMLLAARLRGKQRYGGWTLFSLHGR